MCESNHFLLRVLLYVYRILNIQPEDSGEYMCRARNQFGESEPLVHTIVVEDGRASSLPTIEAPDTADLGETVSTSCIS